MSRGFLENLLLSSAINPLLKPIISRFDKQCTRDGSLLLNSLRDFLGDDVDLCQECTGISRKIAKPFYEIGSRIFLTDKKFMRNAFIQGEYGEAWLKGFGLMMRGIEKFGIRQPFTPAAPFEIVWNVTYRCNLKCAHCYENAGAPRPELSTEGARQVIDKFSKLAGIGLPALSFSGGEPLTRKDFFELLAYARKHVNYVSVASNGTLITKDNARKVKDSGASYVEISLDGASPQVHDEFRGVPGVFEKTLEGIKNCHDVGLDTCIATTVHRRNLHELDKLIQLSKDLDARFMHFNYIPTGRGKEHIELDLTPDERYHVLTTMGKEIIGLYLQAKEEEIRYGRKSNIKVDRYFSTCPQYASVTKELARNSGEKFLVEAHYAAMKGVENLATFLGGCGAGRLYCCLEPNGDIKPCVFFQTNDKTVLGNILKDSFEEIWDNHPFLWKIRSREKLEDCKVQGKTVGCSRCPDKYICGGCRARAYSYFSGNVSAPDVGCIHNKPVWQQITVHENKAG
jgi:radical SAM protein with 4Fe4S-binding SPASM domain